MSDILKNVDQRTKLVGQNRLELLTFHLRGSQRFAINVFKVQEVQSLPKLNLLPQSDPNIVGVTVVRGQTIPVIDLSQAIGRSPIPQDENANIIVTEYNQSIQAFLVGKVDRIFNLNWEDITPPPSAVGAKNYLTALTQLDDKIVEIIDVERVLANVINFQTEVSDDVLDQQLLVQAAGMEVLVVDDSPVAVEQVKGILRQLGLTVHSEPNGLRGLQRLQQWRDEGLNVADKLLMLITDAEMPEMDGYRLTTEIRHDAQMKDLYIMLHTSLSGAFNKAMVQQVGCDDFISKLQPDALATAAQERIRQRLGRSA